MATKRKASKVRSVTCGEIAVSGRRLSTRPHGRLYTAIPEWASFVVVYTTPIVGYTGPNVCVVQAFDSQVAAESWAMALATTLTGTCHTVGFVLIYAMAPRVNPREGIRTFASEYADAYRCIDPGGRMVKSNAVSTGFGHPMPDALTDREAEFIRSLGSEMTAIRDAKSRKLIPSLESRGLVQSYRPNGPRGPLHAYATTEGGMRAQIAVMS